jgi:CubicO group peptidase (beta-lactamase class C family)
VPANLVDLVSARGAVAQLCVVRDGRVVLDRAIGCRPDSLFWIFSTSKPFAALLVHLLAQRGELDLDRPVAAYWPAFGQRGKDGITTRQVLQHRAGVPLARGLLGDALAMTDWDRAVRDVERARPRWAPGEVPAYHILSFGVILGELARRVSGVPVRELLAEELLGPLGLRDIHLGLPDQALGRAVPVRGRSAARVGQGFVNRRTTRQAVIPAAGVSCTARQLAEFYQALLDGAILSPETVEQARTPSSEGEVDRIVRLPIRWSQGFQLGGPGWDPVAARPMGRRTSPQTYGHNGSNCCLAWADPVRRLVFVYLTNQLTPGHQGARHQNRVSDAVVAAWG